MPPAYALLRAGFPYLKTIGEFIRTSLCLDVAIGKEGRIYCLVRGNSGPITVTNLNDDDLGAFAAPDFGYRLPNFKCSPGNRDTPIREGALRMPVQVVLDRDENLYITDDETNMITVYSRFGRYLGRWGVAGAGDGEARLRPRRQLVGGRYAEPSCPALHAGRAVHG